MNQNSKAFASPGVRPRLKTPTELVGMEFQLHPNCSENGPKTVEQEDSQWDGPASGILSFLLHVAGQTGRNHIPFQEVF
jgi:hypothetical protein